ncbi:cysteine desulfurase, partial [Patescibacteria group bacterium]|nr:cysteine desulfurase [Patescibacteria group bacterium]MBU1922384.1 cysteine desulfurase [Patescibacteria group bacterium]
MKKVYLDNAATTYVDARVRRAMESFYSTRYGNASSFHSMGKDADNAIEDARKRTAEILNCRAREIIFCSGGTESDNMAILGAARANKDFGNHVICSKIEHHAVLESVHHLKKEGFEATYAGVDEFGIVDVEEIRKKLTPKTILVSIMMANNEIGAIQPIGEIGRMILKWRKEHKIKYPIFHCDACQAAGVKDLNVEKSHVDLLTLNGGKIYGPKGAGAFYVREGVKIEPLMYGGGQERGVRPGTENVAAIVGFGEALEIAQKEKDRENKRLIKLRDYFIEQILQKIPKSRLNGHLEKRLPNNVNVSIFGVEGEALVLYLDAKGVYASSGSACTSRALDPSHVLLACGLSKEAAHSSVRFTLGRKTTKADLDYVL